MNQNSGHFAGYNAGVSSTIANLVVLAVLHEYHAARFTPDELCYCGHASCDRNLATEEMWSELSALLYAIKMLTNGRIVP